MIPTFLGDQDLARDIAVQRQTTVFDQSKEPAVFSPQQVVPGFSEALQMMRPGSKMIAVLPPELGYGARGAGNAIKPYETLIFEIETIGLDTPQKK